MVRKTKRNRRRKRTRRYRGGQSGTISFYNTYHYGDNILNLKFLYNISKILKMRGIRVDYYYDDGYNKNKGELERYIDKDVVQLLPLKNKPDGSIEVWMGTPIDGVEYYAFDVFYPKLYTKILRSLAIPDKIDVSLYQQEPYLEDLYNKFDEKFKDLDILIINAEPHSHQFVYDKAKMDELCIRLHGKYKIATTSSVNDSISCTMRDGLAMQDIGAVSTHAKYIIAVFSGPITACFNPSTKKSVKRWFIMTTDPYVFTQIDCVLVPTMDKLANIENEFT